MRVLKWTPMFHVEQEPPIAPVWVSFERLPFFMFSKGPLFSIARLIGKPLKLDAATESLARPSVARVCIELDLLKPLPRRIFIGQGEAGFWQAVEYDNLPSYCSGCSRFGHKDGDCSQDQPPPLQPKPKQIWKPKPVMSKDVVDEQPPEEHQRSVFAEPVS